MSNTFLINIKLMNSDKDKFVQNLNKVFKKYAIPMRYTFIRMFKKQLSKVDDLEFKAGMEGLKQLAKKIQEPDFFENGSEFEKLLSAYPDFDKLKEQTGIGLEDIKMLVKAPEIRQLAVDIVKELTEYDN